MPEFTLPIDGYLILLALIVGSFVNLAADRLPRHESLTAPRSHCRGCGRVLNAVDLLPVAGYVLRGGRCASCKASIGATSPVVEATCGVLMGLAVLTEGPWPGAATGMLLIVLWGALVTGIAAYRHHA